MKLPKAESAVVPAEKVREYLLSPANPRASGKASFFHSLGFETSNWEELRRALLEIALVGEATPGQNSEFGAKYEIRAIITGPTGRRAMIKSVWIVDAGDDHPRFITAFPD